MKRRYLFLTLVVLAGLTIGCAPKKYQVLAPCAGKTKMDILAGMTALVAVEGMTITMVNENIGVLQAASGPETSIWTGQTSTNQWSLTFRGDTVVLMAKTASFSQNAFGATKAGQEVYYNDKTDPDVKWYWNVRNGIGTLCETQTIVIDENGQAQTGR